MAGNQVEHVEELGKYITIAKQQITWEQVIKKSRFIVNIARVSNEEEAKQFIDSISLTHRKATHNVWAYLLGDRNEIQRYSDNSNGCSRSLDDLKQLGISEKVANNIRISLAAMQNHDD